MRSGDVRTVVKKKTIVKEVKSLVIGYQLLVKNQKSKTKTLKSKLKTKNLKSNLSLFVSQIHYFYILLCKVKKF